MLTLDKLQCRGTKTDGQITSFYCTGEDSGNISTDMQTIADIDLSTISPKYICFIVRNTSKYDMYITVKQLLPNTDTQINKVGVIVRRNSTSRLEFYTPARYVVSAMAIQEGATVNYYLYVLLEK